MSGAVLAPVWELGPRIAATVLGLPFTVYRPGGDSPLGFQVAVTPAWITGDRLLMATKAIEKARGYAAIDPDLIRVGDYLIGPLVLGAAAVTFFVASLDLPAPIEVVLCNSRLTLSRPNTASYTALNNRTAYATAWPASLLMGGGQSSQDIGLPTTDKLTGYRALLPVSLPTAPRAADFVQNDAPVPEDFMVSGVESTEQGYRLDLSGRSP